MDTLEKLFQIASDENIIIDYADSLPDDLEGLYLHLEDIGHIISILYYVKENILQYSLIFLKLHHFYKL